MKHRADFQAMLTSLIAKRTSSRENRIRADNVALMTFATIRIQHGGGTRNALERLYEIARQEERTVFQQHETALATSHAALSKIKPTMSMIKDAEGFSTVNHWSSPPLLTANHAPPPGGKIHINLFTEEFLKAGEDDLKDYSLNPSSRQPTKKAFCRDETSLVTAALSTTTANSPARASIYTKKRVALASPAKFGNNQKKDNVGHPVTSKVPPSAVHKQEATRTMEDMECSMEEYKATQKAKMAPLEQLVNEEEQESLAKEAARVIRIQMKGDHYAGITRVKLAREAKENVGHHQAKGDNEEDDTTDNDDLDPGSIYSRQSDGDDGSFSYHDSEASSVDDDEEEFGEGASGYSPLVMGQYKPEDAMERESFEWMKEVESRGTFDIKDLLAVSINQIFPCVACNNQKNILDPSTWVPAFLRKSTATTWDVFNVDFDQTVHDLKWEGDNGLGNLRGLYYKWPDAQFIRSFKLPSTAREGLSLDEGKMKGQGGNKIISDDATTAVPHFLHQLQASRQLPPIQLLRAQW